MKLSDFNLSEPQTGRESALEYQRKLNRTATDYPAGKPVSAVFKKVVETWPQQTAAVDQEHSFTYSELDRQSDRLARWLIDRGLQNEDRVGVFMSRSAHIAWVLPGILKAGGVYVPLDPKTPEIRQRYILDEAEVRILVSSTAHLRQAQRLLWFCDSVTDLFFADSDTTEMLTEDTVEMMREDTWKFIRREMYDDVSGGGWKSSYTGKWLSREVMDDYADNALKKIRPHVDKNSTVLEVGCASGITLFKVAPLVKQYVGTELEPDILEWTRRIAANRGIGNIDLQPLAGHELDRLQQTGFDLIIINSVLQCFSGHQYLKQVLTQCMDLLNDKGTLFLGNIWDLDLHDDFVASLQAFEQEHAGEGYTTKVDRSGELFINRGYIEDLRHEFPAISDITFSELLGDHRSELSDYTFDAVLRIDKTSPKLPESRRRKLLADRKDLPEERTFTAPDIRADQPAYIMFTSGTTGRPKGVVIPHRAVNRLVINTNFIDIEPSDRFMQTGSLAFDASTLEIWGPLMNGGSIFFPTREQMLDPDGFSRCIRENNITMLFLTTGLFNSFVDHNPAIFQPLKTVLSGGDKASVSHFNKVRKACPDTGLVNGYGPTENTTFTACFSADKTYARSIPIGIPVSNTTVYILDDNRQPVPAGSAGEIYTGGAGVAIGYLNDPRLTAERFVRPPFDPDLLLYKTGDRGRFLEDGNIMFMGRTDHQVKVRGYRIELSEIESEMDRIPAVDQVAVTLFESDEGDKRIVAYYTGSSATGTDLLKEHLLRSLPEYMVPAQFVRMQKLPLNANGKVDRARLPEPDRMNGANGQPPANRTAPATGLETTLLQLWEDLLGRRDFGVTDDFFRLGGHSLKVTQLVSQIHRKLDRRIPLTTVFKAPTIRELARYIEETSLFNTADHLHNILVPMGRHQAGQPAIILLPPGSGYSISYQKLAERIDRVNWYGITFVEADNHLRRYYEAIKAEQPDGPYVFMGYSAGGKLGFHLAAYFEQQGEVVSDILMLDSARYYRTVDVTNENIDEVADNFLGDVRSPVIREQAIEKIRAYRRYLGQRVETATIQANITNLRAEDSDDFYRNEAGEEVASTVGWEELTRGTFELLKAEGPHWKMLDEPYLSKNCQRIRSWIDQYTAAKENIRITE